MSWWDYPSKLAALVYVEYIEVIHVEVKLGSRLGTKETRSLYIVCLIKVPIFGWVYFLGVFLETWIVDCKSHKIPEILLVHGDFFFFKRLNFYHLLPEYWRGIILFKYPPNNIYIFFFMCSLYFFFFCYQSEKIKNKCPLKHHLELD